MTRSILILAIALAAVFHPSVIAQTFTLHGHFGIDQPTERWATSSKSDHVFALNNWLLSEFDRASPSP